MEKIFVKVNQDGYIIDYLIVGFLNEEEASLAVIPDGFIELDYNPLKQVADRVDVDSSDSSTDDLFFDPDVKEIKSMLMYNVNTKRFEYISKAVK